MSSTCLVRRANSRSMVARIVSNGVTSDATEASSPASSRTRSAKAARDGVPSLMPASRRIARTTFSIVRISLRIVRRATRSERHRRHCRLLTWTCRNQPVRMICARTRASLRSVLFGIVFIAALACRVSMQIAGRPASLSSSCSQAVSEQASRPRRSRARPSPRRTVTSASGSLADRASLTMRPVSSTTQMAVSSKDTSNPAKYFMAAPARCLWRFDIDHVLTSRKEQPLALVTAAETLLTPSVR
jgi:hypothetical protein